MKINKVQLNHDITGHKDAETVLREKYAPIWSSADLDEKLELTRQLREYSLSSVLIAAALGVSQPTAASYVRRSGAAEPKNLLGAGGYTMSNPRYGEVNTPRPHDRRGRPLAPSPRLLRDETVIIRERAKRILNTGSGGDPLVVASLKNLRDAVAHLTDSIIESDSSASTDTPAPKMDA